MSYSRMFILGLEDLSIRTVSEYVRITRLADLIVECKLVDSLGKHGLNEVYKSVYYNDRPIDANISSLNHSVRYEINKHDIRQLYSLHSSLVAFIDKCIVEYHVNSYVIGRRDEDMYVNSSLFNNNLLVSARVLKHI